MIGADRKRLGFDLQESTTRSQRDSRRRTCAKRKHCSRSWR